MKISIRFRCILWGGGSDDRDPILAVGQGFDSIPNLENSYYINHARMAQESAIKTYSGRKGLFLPSLNGLVIRKRIT